MSSQLQHRLLQLEVEPPAGLWDAISDALDEQSAPAAEKLRSFEVTPPPQLWLQLESNLDSAPEVQDQAIPLYRRYATALRYGSAVAILLLVAVTITLLVNNSGASDKIAQQPSASQSAVKATAPAHRETMLRRSDDEQEETPRSRVNEPVERSYDEAASSPDENLPTAKAPQRSFSSRYLTVATEAGKSVRLSKKVYPVFDCAEHSSTLERLQCQENIEALQKMASSLASPSGDFASLIDMIKTLEENR
jgi:hypothetical protein